MWVDPPELVNGDMDAGHSTIGSTRGSTIDTSCGFAASRQHSGHHNTAGLCLAADDYQLTTARSALAAAWRFEASYSRWREA